MNQKLRELVLIRDNRTCQICGVEKDRLDVHHLIPRSKNGRDDFNNLVTLCHSCHMRVEPKKSKKRYQRTLVSINLDDDILEEIDRRKEEYWTRSGYLNFILREGLMK